MAKSQMVKRPWQGTTLGVFQIIAIVLMAMGAILMFSGASFISSMFNSAATMEGVNVEGASMITNMLASLGGMVAAIMLPFIVLFIFMAIGTFKGQKWAIIVSLVLGVLSVISVLLNFDATSLVFNAFFIYLEVMCLKHPYYNQA